MTVQEVVLDLLSYANVYGFELGGVPEDETEIVRAVAGVNHALQDIYRDGPSSLKYDSRSSFVNAPTTITLACTLGGKTATKAGSFAEWMRGCSVMIEGDSILNRIVDITTVGGNSVFSLQRAYLGATGSHSGLVYGDCFLMDSDVVAVIEPVCLSPDNIRLWPAQTKADFMRTRYWSCPVSGRYCCYIPFYTTWEKVTGVPTTYRVEQRSDSAIVGGGSIYLGLNAMPTVVGNVSYDVYRKPALISRDDLAESGGDDPDVAIAAIPEDMVESILLPIARFKYTAAHPEAKVGEKNTTLKVAYDEAVASLKGEGSPQINANRARYI